MKLIRAVLKFPKIVGVIILLCFFGALLNSGITFTIPPQNHPPQRIQSLKYSVQMLNASQIVPINQTWKTTTVEDQHVLISNRAKAVTADERNVFRVTDKGISNLNRLTVKWTPDTMSDRLASDSVNDIPINVNLVGVATERGTSQLDLAMWQNFDTRDELVRDNVMARDGSYAWFGIAKASPTFEQK